MFLVKKNTYDVLEFSTKHLPMQDQHFFFGQLIQDQHKPLILECVGSLKNLWLVGMTMSTLQSRHYGVRTQVRTRMNNNFSPCNSYLLGTQVPVLAFLTRALIAKK